MSMSFKSSVSHLVLNNGSSLEVRSEECWPDHQTSQVVLHEAAQDYPLEIITQITPEAALELQNINETPQASHDLHSMEHIATSTTALTTLNFSSNLSSSTPFTRKTTILISPAITTVPPENVPVTTKIKNGSICANANSSQVVEEQQYVCKCGESFSQRGCLTTHMRVHTGVKPFECDICLKRFAHKQNKEFHMRRHTGERPYKCDKCERSFICVALLNRHKREHEGNYAYHCNLCNQGFILKRNYVEHMNAHTNTRPFKCSECDKNFSRREALRIHKKIHTGENPYVCKECGKAFLLRTRLELHMRRHTGETPYMCLDCGKAFYTSPQLNEHQRKHKGTCQNSDYKCQICGSIFKKQCDLSAHALSHQSSVKTALSCNHCKSEFSRQQTLNAHSCVHDSNLPFHCDLCFLFFPDQTSCTHHCCEPPPQTKKESLANAKQKLKRQRRVVEHK